jgi:ABC-type dipeptide/oligopeptide/nickel transport system permease component
VPVLFAITLITFMLSHIVPGDPARLVAGINAPQEEVERLRVELGLHKSLPEQYTIYLRNLARGDLGTSHVTQRPVRDDLRSFFPATFELAAAALLIALALGVPLGVLAALHQGRFADHVGRVLALAGVAVPSFWLAIVLLLIFYRNLGWLPASGQASDVSVQTTIPSLTGMLVVDSLVTGHWSAFTDALSHLVLPAFCLSLTTLALVIRMTRSSMVEVLGEPYVATARAKGLPERRVIFVHALKNALIPVLTIIGLSFGFLLGGSVLIEKVFAWPGIGLYAVDSIAFLDYNAILGVTLVATVSFIFVNLAVDVLYAKLDPRIRL